MHHKDFGYEELTWMDVREEVKETDKKLAAIIDEINPSKNFSFIKVRYQYGDSILKKGELHLPYNDNTIPISSPGIPSTLKSKLNYSSVPLSLILNKSVEVFFETEDRCMPSKLFAKGTTFGLWEAFDPVPSEFIKKVWNLSAGARTTFLLPKISDAVSHNRLKRDFGIHAYPPKTLLDHQKVFAELAKKIDNDWHCDILFFTRDWLSSQGENSAFLKLHHHWLFEAWNQSYNCRSQMSYDVAWEEFSKELSRKNYKPRANSINAIKHLLTIGEGIFPGFIPALEDENALPVRLIQKAYMESYMLKNYAPTIMHTHHLRKKGESVYYSASLPTQLEYLAQASTAPSIMGDMRELKHLVDILQNTILEHTVDYQFFHSDRDKLDEIRSASEIPLEDKKMERCLKQYPDGWFCDNSPFWRGCIRVDLIGNK